MTDRNGGLYMKNRSVTRVLALALTLALCLSLVPMSARAGNLFTAYFFVGNQDSESSTQLVITNPGTITLKISLGLDGVQDSQITRMSLYDAENSQEKYVLYANGVFNFNGSSIDNEGLGYTGYTIDIAKGSYDLWIEANNETYVSVPEGGSGFYISGSLPGGMVSVPYSQTLSTSDGRSATWSVDSGALPAGLTLTPSTGVISGTPTQEETASFTIKAAATDGSGNYATTTFTLTIEARKDFTINYSLNGGTGANGADYSTKTILGGEKITLPAAPSRVGYTFAGWSDGSGTYTAGASYTVTQNTYLYAQWTALPGVTVKMPSDPSDLGQVVGSVNLCGTQSSDSASEQYLWGKNYRTPTNLPATIDLSAAALGGKTYSKLTLYAYVDGQNTEIASWSGSVSAPASGTNATVTLTKTGPSYTILEGVEVTGLTEGVDYTVGSIQSNASTYISPYSLPMLVTTDKTYSVKLNGVQGSPHFTEYNWDALTENLPVAKNKLTLTAPELGNTVEVGGTVCWANDNGAANTASPAAYVTVQATQVVGGVSRTITANTDRNGHYNNLNLYPGAGATFTVLNGWRTLYVTGDKTLTPSAESTPNTKDLTVKQVRLSTDITLKTNDATPSDAQKALVERYLSAMDWMGELTMKVTRGTNSTPDCFTFSPGSLDTYRDSSYLYNTAAAGSLSCELTGSIIQAASVSATRGTNGDWSISFTPTLNPGVVVDLKAGQTMSVFFAYFDASEALIGESSSFAISEYHRDYAQPCPVGTQTVVLLPGSYKGTLQKTVVDGNTVTITGIAYSDLTETGSTYEVLKTWTINTAMAVGRIEALETYEISKEATENALFVTKPSSTLFASAESFVGDSDLISFTGSIGLDTGLKDGKLTALYINPESAQAGGYNNTATVQTLVIDGQSYTPQMSSGGVYFVNNNAIDLPCDYSIYCTPGSMTWDMSLTVTANVQYTDGNNNFYDQNSQLVGSSVVSRPGASLDTLSTFVCEDKVLISGTAKTNETVTIYDDGAVIGTATGDSRWGEWSALVPLHGADMSDAKLPTSHKLYAVSASGVVSDPLTVIHYKDGPQLKQFTMSWKPYRGSSTVNTINVGGAYTYTGGMYDTTFTARFDNPDALDTKTGWSSKVIFKVYTTDGEIRFLEAAGGADGVFTATVPTALRSSVTSAEVMYEPKVPGGMTVKNGVATGQAPKEYVEAVKDAAGDVKKELNDNALYPTRSYVVNYGNDGNPTEIKQYNYDVTVDKTRNTTEQLFYHSGDNAEQEKTTITVDSNPTDELVKMVKDYNDAGLRVNSIRTVEDSGISLKSWLDSVVFDVSALNHIAYDEKTGDAGSSRSRAYSISQLYRGGQLKDGNRVRNMTAKEAFEHEKSFMEAAKNTFPDMTHTKLALENNGDSYDVYQIILANQYTGLEDCNLTVTFLACDGVYSMAATAIFSPQYCSKMIGDKWDTEIKPTAEAAIANRNTSNTSGSLPLVTASANGYISVSNRLLAAAPPIRVMAAEVDEPLPIEDDQNSYLFKDVHGNTIESDHEEYMRSIRTSVGLPAEEATDEWEILRRQQLHNYDEGKDGKWSDPAYYFYNGDFKPRSSIAQSCMSDVNAYYSRQRSDVATTGLSTSEEWTGHGNLGAALTSGVDPTKVSTYAGDVTAGANILLNTYNSHEAKNDLRAMMGDLNQLKNSPCYKKLNESQRELVDKSYDEFKYWYDSAMNQITATQVLGAACNVGGCVNSRVEYAGKLKNLRNWGAGVILSSAGEMNSAVGGQMIKTSFTNAIVTYNEGYKQMKGVLRSRSVQLEDPDCKGKPVSAAGPEKDDGEKKDNKTGNDPSGIVYEGVLQNPVAGAVVTLYYAADDSGNMKNQDNSSDVTQLRLASDVRTLIPDQATQTTGPDGRYQWGVPEGLWYVTAEYGGLTGNSGADKEAKVSVTTTTNTDLPSGTYNLLPVLPVQLDVNIPLVDTTAPVVEAVNFTTEGIYVTFSKYMVDSGNDTDASVLTKDNYTLYNNNGVITDFTVELMDQGNAPENVDANKTTYTRTVCLKPAEGTTFPTGTMNLTVNGTVTSYAATPMGAAYSTEQTVKAMTTLAAPTFSRTSGTTVQRGDTVTLTAPAKTTDNSDLKATDVVKLYYTTDGSTPDTNSNLYDGPIAITDNMTIKAIAVCVGYKNSTSANAAYSIKDKLTPEQYDGTGNGNGAGAGGGSAGSAVNLPASLTGGTVAVSPTTAAKGTKVTITPTPDAGYQVDKVSVTDSKGNPVAVTDNGDGTYCFTMPAGAVNVDVTFRPVGWKFVDVADDAWYHDAVYHCYNSGYFKGTDEDHFTPSGTMTRAMFATVLYRIAGEPAATGANPFSDVASGTWYTDAVIWAASQNVIKGYGNGKFGTNDSVTREQMVTIFWRYNGKPAGTADLSAFKDAGSISDWAKDAFAWAVSAGVISGKGNGVLDPAGTATRAEVAQIVMNYDTKVE